MIRLVCVHCGWEGDGPALKTHPRLGDGVCPWCWQDGFETRPREKMGPLMEAFAAPEPAPRQPKAIIDWTEEEWAVAEKIERFRDAHERAPVYLKTTVKHARQGGFGFMREEFRVASVGRDPKSGRKGGR